MTMTRRDRMMAEYTPTTNGIRNRYLWWYEQQRDGGAKNFTKYPDEVLAQFDRWLEQHDARTREELLVRLADSGAIHPHGVTIEACRLPARDSTCGCGVKCVADVGRIQASSSSVPGSE